MWYNENEKLMKKYFYLFTITKLHFASVIETNWYNGLNCLTVIRFHCGGAVINDGQSTHIQHVSLAVQSPKKQQQRGNYFNKAFKRGVQI